MDIGTHFHLSLFLMSQPFDGVPFDDGYKKLFLAQMLRSQPRVMGQMQALELKQFRLNAQLPYRLQDLGQIT